MSTTIKGNAVPTPHRDPNKTYVSDRNVQNLEKLGVKGDELTAAKRGDEILDNTGSMPGTPSADGNLHLFELDRLDEPQNKAALFPSEANAVPTIHKLFEIPDSAPVTLAPLETLTYRLDRKLVSPAVTSVKIADLATPELQTAAKRVQLVKNSDSDASTITRDDIQWALQPANVGPFTGPTVNYLQQILGLFHDDQFAEKVIGVLPPNVQARELVSGSGVKVSVEARVGFHTSRPYPDDGRSYRWAPAIAGQSISIEAPVGYKVFVKTVANGLGASDPGNAEAVVDGNGGKQNALVNANLIAGQTSLWVQIFDPVGAMVKNVRVGIPKVDLASNTFGPGMTSGRRVQEWQDTAGNVVNHRANGDNGIPGYSLDGHPHLFAREAILT